MSDNGTNFVGAERILKDKLKRIDQEKIHRQMSQRGIKREFIANRSPRWGGAWERLVQSTKKVLYPFHLGQTLTDELLQPTPCIVENILNGRPLTRISTDPDDELPLTPNMLLTSTRCANLPPGVFKKRDFYSRRYWRQANFIADCFQRRWLIEYLPTLQTRSKWQDAQQNLKKVDLVLLSDEQLHRGQWRLGIVTKPISGNDGLVRSAKVKFDGTIKTRPVVKLCSLELDCDTS